MTDETETQSEIQRRDKFLFAMGSAVGCDKVQASAMLAGYLAGRLATFADMKGEDPSKLAAHIRNYALEEGRRETLDPEDRPAIPSTARYTLELEFSAPLSSALAVTSAIVQVALPKAWRRKVQVEAVRISTGEQAASAAALEASE